MRKTVLTGAVLAAFGAASAASAEVYRDHSASVIATHAGISAMRPLAPATFTLKGSNFEISAHKDGASIQADVNAGFTFGAAVEPLIEAIDLNRYDTPLLLGYDPRGWVQHGVAGQVMSGDQKFFGGLHLGSSIGQGSAWFGINHHVGDTRLTGSVGYVHQNRHVFDRRYLSEGKGDNYYISVGMHRPVTDQLTFGLTAAVGSVEYKSGYSFDKIEARMASVRATAAYMHSEQHTTIFSIGSPYHAMSGDVYGSRNPQGGNGARYSIDGKAPLDIGLKHNFQVNDRLGVSVAAVKRVRGGHPSNDSYITVGMSVRF